MKALEKLVGATDADRKVASERDFFTFCRTYLPHYFGAEPAPYHRVIMDIVSSGALTGEHLEALRPLVKEDYHGLMQPAAKLSGIIDVEPRGFGKSVRFSLAFPLWVVLYKKRNFPVLLAANQASAEKNLEAIKAELTENELIYQDFGELKGNIWQANKVTLANGTALAAFGAGSATRGTRNRQNRPDVAICDDIMTDSAAASPTQRDKIYRWFKRVVLPLGKDLLPIVINTITHQDDIVCRLLKELEEGTLKGWAGFRFAARTPSGASLWEAYWSDEKLAKKQEEVGSMAWSTEYMNEPLSEEDAIIKSFTYYEPSAVNLVGRKAFGGVDPATGTHDKCAFVTLVEGADGVLYVAQSWGQRLSETPFLENLIATFQVWKHAAIGFEDVAFQGIYKNNLMEKAAQRRVYLPINGRKTGGLAKQERVRELAPLIEAGLIRFQREQKELLEQLSMFTPDGPKSAYDDEADALWYAFKEAQAWHAGSAPVALVSRIFNKTRTKARDIIRTITS